MGSLRNNLYGYSAFYLAKNVFQSQNEKEFDGALRELNPNNIKPISGIKPTDGRLKGKCEDVFKYLYDKVNDRMQGNIYFIYLLKTIIKNSSTNSSEERKSYTGAGTFN